MDKFNKKSLDITKPHPGEISKAKSYPNGWVYRIAGNFLPHESVPPEAIIGAWKVNKHGEIIGKFECNPNYNSDLHSV